MKFIHQNSQFSEKDITLDNIKKLKNYTKTLKEIVEKSGYTSKESSLNLPFDENFIKDCLKLGDQKISSDLKYLIIIGIGGSNLGTKAIYDAMEGSFDTLREGYPKAIFVDTSNKRFLNELENFIIKKINKPSEVLVNTISKSGGTTETLFNTEFVLNILGKKFKNPLERLVITTDENSPFWKEAEEKQIDHLTIPKNVGGRYSVLSTVGLFPLVCLGLDAKKLLIGAQEMIEKCLNDDILKNPAMYSAAVLFSQYQKGKTVNDNFIFNSELESLGKWYRQLMGESIGKEKNIKGEIINVGINPSVSIGSTDLHSVGQLYLGGPKDKITTFIYSQNSLGDIKLSNQRYLPSVVKMINNKSVDDIMKAILDGVKISYEKKKIPFVEVILKEINEQSLGQFMQFKMLEIMYLGVLFDINPFDQPNVEDYKIETKRLLEKL